jgi:hypothetical protein
MMILVYLCSHSLQKDVEGDLPECRDEPVHSNLRGHLEQYLLLDFFEVELALDHSHHSYRSNWNF